MTEILNKELSRKTFLKGGGAMVVGFGLAGTVVRRPGAAGIVPYASAGPAPNNQVDSFITIHADNTASINTGRIELGQGSNMGLMMIAADELDMSIGQMRFVRADTNISPNTGNTTGSSSIRSGGPRVRAAAAYAKQALLGMAAKELGAAASSPRSASAPGSSSTRTSAGRR